MNPPVVSDLLFRFSPEANQETNRRILLFAEAMNAKKQSAGYYARYRRTTTTKATLDICLGKKAEVVAMCVLRDHFGFPFAPIDLEIRNGNQKGWKPDLCYNEIDPELPNVHVKCCHSGTLRLCEDYSWTFQERNHGDMPGGHDDVFDGSDDDLLVLVYMDDWYEDRAVVKAVVSWGYAKTLFREPKLKKHRNAKNCLYLKDLV